MNRPCAACRSTPERRVRVAGSWVRAQPRAQGGSLVSLAGILAFSLTSACGTARADRSPTLARPTTVPTTGSPAPRTGRTTSAPARDTGGMGRASVPVGDLSGPLRLDALLPLLLARNPGIRAAHARLVAATERLPQAVALPDPMVEATYFTRNAMAPDAGFPRYNLMFRQELPFPTTLALRGRGAAKLAEAEGFRYEATVRDAVTRLKEVHAERAYLAEAGRIQRAVADVYRRYVEVSRGGIESGRTRLPESFRAESLLAQAAYDLLVVEDQRTVEDERLRTLLDVPTEMALGEPVDAYRVAPVEADTQALARRAEEYSQELRTARAESEAAELGARRARSEAWAPTFFLGAGLMRNDQFDMASGSREDSTVVTLGMTIPVGNPGRRAAIREADALASAARASEAAEGLRVRAEVARAAFRLRNAERLAILYDATLVPQAETALLRSQEMVKEGQESLSSSLELAATWQGLRIAQARAVADHAQAVAAIERLLGTSATLVASGDVGR